MKAILEQRTFRISPTEHPSKQRFVQPDAEDPITMAPYDPTKGLVEIHWFVQVKDPKNKNITRNEPHTMYLDPDTFARLKTDSAGRKINPFTRQPIVSFQTISPPRQITKAIQAAKVIQGHARNYLAKKAANRPPTSPGSASSPSNGKTLTYRGQPVRVPVAADWKPKRAPKEHIDYEFDWDGWRNIGNEAERNTFFATAVKEFIASKRPSRFAPGDIITVGAFPVFFHFYISLSGVVKEIPVNDDYEPFYIPKGVMEPFYKHRETSQRFYGAAVFFNISFLIERNQNLPPHKEYILHQYHRDTETIDHYDYLPSTGEVVIKRNVPIIGMLADHLAGRIRSGTSSDSGSSGGAKKARKARETRAARKTGKK